MKLNKGYWEERYESNTLGWDAGRITTPLKQYIDQIDDKDLKILIPGVGYGYEAIYLWKRGFKNTWVIDLARQPLNRMLKEIPDFPQKQLIKGDFFAQDYQDFDLVIEQTFFCALDPVLRGDYVKKMHELLKNKGVLAGLFFDFPLTEKGPPFGGSKSEYLKLFETHFDIKILKRAYNSIPPRQGKELFFIFEKKSQ